jgi:predicted Zn-dependent protease
LLANAFIASGTVNEEAFDAYCVLYKLEPNNQRLLELMAQYYSQQEMHDELACEVFRKLAAREPDNKKIVRKYVQVLSARGKVDDEALAAYTRLLQLEPEDNMVRSTLVKGLQQAGEYARAIDECRILLDADPSNMLVHQMFIKSHLNSGKQDKLLEFYDDFLAVFPDNKSVRELVKDLNRKITASQ